MFRLETEDEDIENDVPVFTQCLQTGYASKLFKQILMTKNISALMNKLHNDINSICVRCEDILSLDDQKRIEFFESMPDRITRISLIIRINQKIDVNDLKNILVLICDYAKNINALDLSGQGLLSLSKEEIKQAMNAIPLPISELDLSDNNYDNASFEKWRSLLRAIPRHITKLNLKGNFLYRLGIENLSELFQDMPPLKALSLSENSLEEKQKDFVNDIMPALLSEVDSWTCHDVEREEKVENSLTDSNNSNSNSNSGSISKNYLSGLFAHCFPPNSIRHPQVLTPHEFLSDQEDESDEESLDLKVSLSR